VTVGRIWRDRDLGQFAGTPALDRSRSDWLAAVRLGLPGKVSLANRALFDDDLQFSRNELRFDWHGDELALSGAYLWMRANAVENRPGDVSELTLDAEYRLDANWATSLDYRFDFDQSKAASAKLGLAYINDCISVNLSLSRRFTSSTSVQPTTDFGLEVRLSGFGGGARGGPPGACSG
jgi:LPS-assembly protein